MPDPQPAADAPLSMQDAMGILAARREPEPAAEAPHEGAPEAEEIESDAAPAAEDGADPPEEVIGDEEAEEPEGEPAEPVIAAPKSWAATERAEFAKLPRQVQEIIRGREAERDQAVSRALNEASTAKAEVDTKAQALVSAEVAKVAELHTTLSNVVTQAQAAFAGKWDNVDWVAFARQDPEAYTVAKAEYDAELVTLNRAQQAEKVAATAKQEAARTEFQNYTRAEAAKLSEVAPDLVDPKEGPARRQRVAQFLLGLGVPQEALSRISAVETAVAYDAMRFREGKAKLAAQPKPRAPPAPAPQAAAPTAAPTRMSPQRTGAAAFERLKSSGKESDALAVLKARRRA